MSIARCKTATGEEEEEDGEERIVILVNRCEPGNVEAKLSQKNITWLNREHKKMEHHQSKLTYLDTNDREPDNSMLDTNFVAKYIYIYMIRLCRCVAVNMNHVRMVSMYGWEWQNGCVEG